MVYHLEICLVADSLMNSVLNPNLVCVFHRFAEFYAIGAPYKFWIRIRYVFFIYISCTMKLNYFFCYLQLFYNPVFLINFFHTVVGSFAHSPIYDFFVLIFRFNRYDNCHIGGFDCLPCHNYCFGYCIHCQVTCNKNQIR